MKWPEKHSWPKQRQSNGQYKNLQTSEFKKTAKSTFWYFILKLCHVIENFQVEIV